MWNPLTGRARAQLLGLVAVAVLGTACGQPLQVATWMNIDASRSEMLATFGPTVISVPLEGGIFTRIGLDLRNPLHITGTIDVDQVRIGGKGTLFGQICIRKDTSNPARGSLEIDTLTGAQSVDFPLGIIASSDIQDASGVGDVAIEARPDPDAIQFPLDIGLIQPILEDSSVDGDLELPVALEQEFALGSLAIPVTLDLVLVASSDPPAVSAQNAQACQARWDLQGSELDYVVNPRGTYLHTELDGNARAPKRIDLASLGVVPGDTLRLRRKGSYLQDLNLLGSGRSDMVAVFSGTDALRSSGRWEWVKLGWFGYYRWNPSRVPDAIDAGADVSTPRTFNLLVKTDIPEDFEVKPSLDVVVPAGANYLFLGPKDNLFGDNFSVDLRVGVDVNP